MMVMMVMVTATGIRSEVVVGGCDRLMMVVMVRRGVLVERGGVVDNGGRVRVPLVMRMSDDARRTGGGVHAIVATATSSPSTTDGVSLQPFGRYVQQRRWLLLLLLLRRRRPSG